MVLNLKVELRARLISVLLFRDSGTCTFYRSEGREFNCFRAFCVVRALGIGRLTSMGFCARYAVLCVRGLPKLTSTILQNLFTYIYCSFAQQSIIQIFLASFFHILEMRTKRLWSLFSRPLI